jgi:NAD(P)-dependent dehydrogenase (short-subunit alcohol dehydrogenase family)
MSGEEFKDSSAVVTGGAGGIRRELAAALAGRHARVAILDRNRAAADEVAGEIRALGGAAEAFEVDVADSAKVERTFAAAEQRLGPVGYLVNLAGFDASTEVDRIPDAEWRRMFAVTVDGAFFACRAALPGMMARRFGRIVNMSSLHAIRGEARRAHYAAAKAAIIGFTKSLAREKASYNIRANAVAPGPIETALWRGGRSGTELESAIAQRSKMIPLGRLGRPAEVAAVILFLLSPESDYITGQAITIDGGEIMP